MTSMPPWALIIIGILAIGLGLGIQAGEGGMAGGLIALIGAVAVIAGVERAWKERAKG